jgi:hypothetical protein
LTVCKGVYPYATIRQAGNKDWSCDVSSIRIDL